MARKVYKVEEDLKPYLFPLTNAWKAELFQRLPNLEEVSDPAIAIWEIACRRPVDHYNSAVLLPPRNPEYPSRYLEYATVYCGWKSGGGWDGTGVVVTTNEGYGKCRVFKFALCLHEKTEEGHQPNHGRGWHPGHCKHCGMDMSVDSGD